MRTLILLNLTLAFCTLNPTTFSSSVTPINQTTCTANLVVKPDPGEVIYHDSLMLSIDHPTIAMAQWHSSNAPSNHYAPDFKATKQAYNKPFTISCDLTAPDFSAINNAHLTLSYMSSGHKAAQQEVFSLPSTVALNANANNAPDDASICSPAVTEPVSTPTLNPTTWSRYVETLIRTTDILWVRIILVLLLGLLMSFTPCIYPMIPITIGIMQGQGQRSVVRTFLHACAYTIGIATTFATLGLLAAWSGAMFGMMLTHPLVTLVIVAMLVYLALSMFGLYEIYIPPFLRESNRTHKGSLVSSFLFGAASGTVASPCLSPGLALVLCIVASLKSMFMGFVLLFAFGLGLGIPLLLIGTFSGSLTLLPYAGAWMIEIKKFFGFLLLGMSFYYLKNSIPWWLLLWLFATFITVTGVHYLYQVTATSSRGWKQFKNILGIVLLASAVDLFVEAYQATFMTSQDTVDTFWHTAYDQAVQQAVREKKLLFLDFWTTSCSICTAIDKTLMRDTHVRDVLARFVPTKIELSATDPEDKKFKEKFKLIGVPTFIIYDPVHDTVLKTWRGELYHYNKEQFIAELEQYIH